MLPDITIETIVYLQSLDREDADALAAKIRGSDHRLVPTCQNCIHRSKFSQSWCTKHDSYTRMNQPDCFDPHPDYSQLTAPLK